MKNRDLHYTSLPRDELPLNSAIQFHLQMHIFFCLSLSLPFFPLDARLANGPRTRHRIRCVWSHCFFYDSHYVVYA